MKHIKSFYSDKVHRVVPCANITLEGEHAESFPLNLNEDEIRRGFVEDDIKDVDSFMKIAMNLKEYIDLGLIPEGGDTLENVAPHSHGHVECAYQVSGLGYEIIDDDTLYVDVIIK